jgi:hypothetical protein
VGRPDEYRATFDFSGAGVPDYASEFVLEACNRIHIENQFRLPAPLPTMSSDSEYEMWTQSATEEDVWSDREGGWPVSGVVGEEIDTFGETR